MVLSNIILEDVIDDTISLKMDIVRAVIELALINFDIKFSVKDTSTEKIIYESGG